jgi:hypothetical protein
MSEPVADNRPLTQLDLELLGAPRWGGEERRVCYRRRFFALQRIAPYDGTRIPAEGEFFCVESRDMTSQGVSFLFPARPDFGSLVVAFGEPPMRSYVVAQIVHSTDVVVYPSGLVEPAHDREGAADRDPHQSEQGEPMVLVGCRFVERRAGNASSSDSLFR